MRGRASVVGSKRGEGRKQRVFCTVNEVSEGEILGREGKGMQECKAV
jgi:hypothetical protein